MIGVALVKYRTGPRRRETGRPLAFCEAFNLTNRVNYDDPVRVLSSPNVGQFTQALAPFQMQFGVRFVF